MELFSKVFIVIAFVLLAAYQWDQLNNFTRTVGWNLLFDLNVLLRRGNEWDSSNALELMEYSIKKNYTWNLNFELGNGRFVL